MLKKDKILESNPALAKIKRSRQWLRDGKNSTISNVRVLVKRLLTYPMQMIYIRIMPTSMVKHCLRLSNWQECMKFFKIDWNCSLSLMTFFMSLPSILSKTIGLNTFRKLYNVLFGFGIIFWRHSSFWMIILMCLQDNLFGLEVNILLHLKIALLNFSFEKGFQLIVDTLRISFSKSMFIWWFWAKLNNRWSACHKSSSLRYSWPSYWMILIFGSFHFFTKFMSFQRPNFLFEISWIFWLKNTCLVFLAVFLKIFQSSNCLKTLYFSRSLWQSLFHHVFECLVMLMTWKYSSHSLSVSLTRVCTIHSSISLSEMLLVLSFAIVLINFSMNLSCSLLFLTNVCFLVWTYSSIIIMLIVRGHDSKRVSSLNGLYDCLIPKSLA